MTLKAKKIIDNRMVAWMVKHTIHNFCLEMSSKKIVKIHMDKIWGLSVEYYTKQFSDEEEKELEETILMLEIA